MKKGTTSFVCQECGYDSPAYLGKCPECGLWNSFKEIRISNKQSAISSQQSAANLVPKKLSEINYTEKQKLSTGFSEMDGVFGGGIIPGSVTLLAGDPGIGKSTLLLQLGLRVSQESIGKVLYISGEESEEQIKLRAERIKKKNTKDGSFLLLAATDTDAIIEIIQDLKPALVIIDSIQTISSENAGGLSGAVGQVRYGAAMLVKVAKTYKIPIIIVGHVTKEGMVAGPMVLSHMVDTVLFLEGEKTTSTRILRSFKNRFGPVDEVGIFLMEEMGMIQSQDPQQLFLNSLSKALPGSVIVSTLEGTRAFLVEVQGLVVSSKLPIPRRVGIGIDSRRLELLLAVLQKHCNLPIGTSDIFVNVAGGLKLSDPACDLGICLAIFSSFKNIPLSKTVAIGEVGLLGELRRVNNLEKRAKEARKLGYKQVITSQDFKTLNEVIRGLK